MPRNFLKILKEIIRAAAFWGEEVFASRANPVSIKLQLLAARRTAEWFLNEDTMILGDDAKLVSDGLMNLGQFLKSLRFVDKPVECSLICFSTNLSEISEISRHIINVSADHSYLLKSDNGRKNRNTQRVEPLYQLNSTLSPKWDLPTGRRATIDLSAREINAIFDPDHKDDFKAILTARMNRLTAPLFGAKRKEAVPKTSANGQANSEPPYLPGL